MPTSSITVHVMQLLLVLLLPCRDVSARPPALPGTAAELEPVTAAATSTLDAAAAAGPADPAATGLPPPIIIASCSSVTGVSRAGGGGS